MYLAGAQLDGTVEMDGLSDGTNDGWPDTLKDLDGIKLSIPVCVGPMLGWLDR